MKKMYEDYRARKNELNSGYLKKLKSIHIWLNPANPEDKIVLDYLETVENKKQFITKCILNEIQRH